MKWAWFIPVWLLIGLAGTRSALRERHGMRGSGARGWILMMALVWLPLLCWVIAQFISQD